MQDTANYGGWHRARAVAVGSTAAVAILAAAYAGWGGMLDELHRLEHRSTVQPPDALPALLWAALLLSLLWAALLVVLATATLLRGPSDRDGAAAADTVRRGPQTGGGLIGRVAAVLLAITALSSLSTAAPAFAAVPSATSTRAAATARATVTAQPADHSANHGASTSDPCEEEAAPTPGWMPEKPTRTDQVARVCAPLVTGRPVADDSGEVVVHRGDTLWSIAATHLGPHADAQTIAAEWPRWYAANRHVIGDDPDLVHVGTRLLTPDHAREGSDR